MAERTAWRICSQHRLWSVFGKKRSKNGKVPPVHDDLVERDFTAEAPNQLWLADITEHRTRQGKLYLCAIKDVFPNRIAGYCIDSRMKSRLATTALTNAVARRGEAADCILHTARGSQFRSRRFVHALGRYDMVGSMGRVGTGDNAAMESFFSLLQKNVLDRRHWDTREELRIAIVTWIERTLPSPPTPCRPREVDPRRIRSNHDPTGQSGRVTETVTYWCSRPNELQHSCGFGSLCLAGSTHSITTRSQADPFWRQPGTSGTWIARDTARMIQETSEGASTAIVGLPVLIPRNVPRRFAR